MKLSEIKVDTDKLENGDWVGDLPEMGELQLKVKGLHNAGYTRLQRKLMEAVPRQKRPGGRIDPDALDKITSQCLLEHVLIDWKGLTGDDGEPIPFDKEFARELLFKPEYRRFREAVISAATQVADIDLGLEEADSGNSASVSAGA